MLARPSAASCDLQSRQRVPGRRITHGVGREKAFPYPAPLPPVSPRPGVPAGSGQRSVRGSGGGGCGSILGCPGATRVWQLRHRPYGFLRWMNHRWPWPGSVAPPAAARAPAEAGEGVMKSEFRHGPCHQPLLKCRARQPWPFRRGRCRLGQWQVWQAWHDWELPAMAAPGGVPVGPHQHWSSHLNLLGLQGLGCPMPGPSGSRPGAGPTGSPPCGLGFEGAFGVPGG